MHVFMYVYTHTYIQCHTCIHKYIHVFVYVHVHVFMIVYTKHLSPLDVVKDRHNYVMGGRLSNNYNLLISPRLCTVYYFFIHRHSRSNHRCLS